MAKDDKKKMTFITSRGLYCYKVIPFGPKNVEATYQRLVNKVFVDQLDWNMEAYMDDMIIKSKSMAQHITNLEETFSTLKWHGMRLNPMKCTFGVTSKKFLSFIVPTEG